MRWWEPRPRQPFIGLAICAVAGVAIADRWEIPLGAALAVTAISGGLVLVRPRTWTCWLVVIAGFCALHTMRLYHSPAKLLSREFESENRVVHAIGIVSTEPEKPHFRSRSLSGRFRVRLESVEMDQLCRATNAEVNVSWAGPVPGYGDRVEFVGTGSNLQPVRNPGQFDVTTYLHRQEIYSEIRVRYPMDAKILSSNHGSRLQAFAYQARAWIQQRLGADLDDAPEVSALIGSMVLGMRGEDAEHAKELFQRTGTLHLFAVSGLNIAMLASMAWFLLKPLGCGRRLSVFIIVPLLWGYALVTGLSASCVRATIMGSLLLLGFLFERPPIVYNSLAAAALLILAFDTNEFFTPGYQLSFVLVLIIVLGSTAIQRKVEPWGMPDPFLPRALWKWPERMSAIISRHLAAMIGVTLSAWLGSLLFTIGYFHLFSLAAIFANFVAVPIAFAVLGLGLLSVITSGFAPAVAVLFNNANWVCAKALLFVIARFAELPGGHVYVEWPGWRKASACELTVFDLGQGGAIHLRSAGKDWLFDCGQTFAYEQTVLPYLRTRGVNNLDGVLLSHGDAQHIGGVLEALNDFNPGQIVDSCLKDRSAARRTFHEKLVEIRRGKSLVSRGDEIRLSEHAKLRVLYPPVGLQKASADDKALVFYVDVDGQRTLFMSDSGFQTEEWLLQNEPDLRADLLIKGQHSKDVSGTLNFLMRVHPQAVICAAADFAANAGMLDQWASDVEALGIHVIRQDQSGAVSVELGGGVFSATSFLGNGTFRSRAR